MLCIVVLSGGDYFFGTNVFSSFSLWEPTGALRESGVLYREVCVEDLGAICIIIIDRFYIALFSAFEQTHCARMWFYMSE